MSYGNAQVWAASTWAGLPSGWFPTENGTVINAVVGMISASYTSLGSDLDYTNNQVHVATATDMFLDLIASDFFGFGNFPRRSGETDASYRSRILSNMLIPRGTRAAVSNAVAGLTGYTPAIFEPIIDAPSWDAASYWDFEGRYGSYQMPFQFFITIQRPYGVGIPYGGVWDSAPTSNGVAASGYWDYAPSSWSNEDDLWSLIEDAEIKRLIETVIPAGVTAWVSINGGAVNP